MTNSSLSWILPLALIIESQALPNMATFSILPYWVIPVFFLTGFVLSRSRFLVKIGRLHFNTGGSLLPVLVSLVALPQIRTSVFLDGCLVGAILFSLAFRERSDPSGLNIRISYLSVFAITVVTYLAIFFLSNPILLRDGNELVQELGSVSIKQLVFLMTPVIVLSAFLGDSVKSLLTSRRKNGIMVVGAYGLQDICWSLLSGSLLFYGFLIFLGV